MRTEQEIEERLSKVTDMEITCKKDGMDPFDRFTLKNLGVVFDDNGVVIAKAVKKPGVK